MRLLRTANFYANIVQLAREEDIARVFDMVGQSAARLLKMPYGLFVGGDATIVLVGSSGPKSAIREIARVIAGWKNGAKSFDNGRPQLHKPATKGTRP